MHKHSFVFCLLTTTFFSAYAGWNDTSHIAEIINFTKQKVIITNSQNNEKVEVEGLSRKVVDPRTIYVPWYKSGIFGNSLGQLNIVAIKGTKTEAKPICENNETLVFFDNIDQKVPNSDGPEPLGNVKGKQYVLIIYRENKELKVKVGWIPPRGWIG